MDTPNETLRLIQEYRLIVRPTVTGRPWAAGRFARVTLNNRMEAIPETWAEGWTLEEAVRLAAEKTDAWERREGLRS